MRPSIGQPQLYYDTNVNGTLHLLEAARTVGIERFIFASSSSVYGLSKTVPFSEELHLTQTISPYAATKIAGEFLCSTYSHLYQMRIVALRFFTVYGPRQRPDLAIHKFTRRIWKGQLIDQFGDGTTRRDYTYIDDIIQGVMASLGYDGPLFDIFNLGESETIQLKDLIAAIEDALGSQGADQSAARTARRRSPDLRRYFQSPALARLSTDHAAARRPASFHRMVSSDAEQRVSQGRWRLTIFVAAVVLLPALVSHLIPARRDFDPKPIAELRKKQPEVVMIGDSVLGGSTRSCALCQGNRSA